MRNVIHKIGYLLYRRKREADIVKWVDGRLDKQKTIETEEWLKLHPSVYKEALYIRQLKNLLAHCKDLSKPLPLPLELYCKQIEKRLHLHDTSLAQKLGFGLNLLYSKFVPIALLIVAFIGLGYWIFWVERNERMKIAPTYTEVETVERGGSTFTFRSEVAEMTIVWISP